MKKTYLAGIVVGLLVTAAMSGGACTYNTYYGAGGSSASSASSASGTGSTSGMTSSGTGGMASSSSGMGGSGGSGGAASSSSSSGGCADADGDGYTSKACGGTDCDDKDSQAHPGQTMFFAVPTKGTMNFDYNCDGNETPQLVYYKCSGLCMQMNSVFITMTPCGQMGTVADCNLACQQSNITTQIRACN